MNDHLILLIGLITCVGLGITVAILRTTRVRPPAPAPAQESTLLWVCSCCVLAYANDDTSGCEHSCHPTHVDELLSLIAEDEEITLGMLWEEHAEDCANRLAGTWVEECECEHITFSWSWCGGCGSRLGGERHALTVWSPARV